MKLVQNVVNIVENLFHLKKEIEKNFVINHAQLLIIILEEMEIMKEKVQIQIKNIIV
jgi:hypothetical protein